MATPTFGSRSAINVLDYASGHGFISKNDGDSASAATYDFINIGWTQGSKISNEVEEFDEIDDSGKTVVSRETVKNAMIEGIFLTRDASARNHTLSGGIEYFTYIIVGAKIDPDLTEIWAFPKITFSQAIDYEIGGKARMGYKMTAFAPDEAISIDVTGLDGVAGWDVNSSVTELPIPADSIYVSSDEAKA